MAALSSLLATKHVTTALPTGTGTGVGSTYDTRAAAIAASIPTLGSGGPAAIRTNGYAVAGDHGHGIYIRVGSSPAYSNLIWFTSADGQKWGLVVSSDPLRIEQAGGSTGASGAINSAAIDALHSIYYSNKFGQAYGYAGPQIKFGPGTYNFSGPYFIKGASNISGSGSGFIGGYSTELVFPANSDGIVIGAAGTNGRLYNPSIYGDFDGRGTVIRDISLRGGWASTATPTYWDNNTTGQRGFGILSKGTLTLENVHISKFAEHGVYTKGTAGAGGPSTEPAIGTADNTDTSSSYVCAHGYANNFTYIAVEVETCGGDGYRDIGADANAGNYINCSATENYGWGFNSYAFLGNWFFGCHSATNGIRGGGSILDPNTGKIPGAYQASDPSNATNFVACYSESGQAGSVFGGFSMTVGGLHAAGSPGQQPQGFRLFNNGTDGGYISGFHTPTAGGNFTIGSSNVDQEVFNINGQMFVRNQFGRLVFGSFGVSDTFSFVMGSGYQGGRGADIEQGSVMLSHGVWLSTEGNYTDMRFRGIRNGLPTTGKWARGDHIDLRDPTAGGVWGYVCTTSGDYAGTPPVWKSKGNLAA